jgi:two-component system alkaline phosphatase synthesis response regulator PhoP
MKLLLIEDDVNTANIVKRGLNSEMHVVDVSHDGADGSFLARSYEYDAIILDYSLPNKDGLIVTTEIRRAGKTTPILFLSIVDDVDIKVEALQRGADDYMTKPFNLEELLIRVEKLIAKNKKIDHIKDDLTVFAIGPCQIDFQSQSCIDIHGQKRDLTKKEIQFLKLLIDNKNEIISREHILKMVWGYNVFPTTRTIDNFIMIYRKYFELDPRNPIHFVSVRGVGYKFVI